MLAIRQDTRLVKLLLLFGALNVADALTTWIALSLGAVEVNPLFASLYSHVGYLAGSIIKLAGAGVITLNFIVAYPASPKWTRREAIAFNIVMIAVVLVNTFNCVVLFLR